MLENESGLGASEETNKPLRTESGAFDIDEELKLLDTPFNMNNPSEIVENVEEV